jgi:CBS domain-containing protein
MLHNAASTGDDMSVKIHDLMAKRVITAQPHHTIEHVRGLMQRNRIHAVPIVDTEGKPVGFVSSADLATEGRKDRPISSVMTDEVFTVPQYNDVDVAARMMRNRRIHHVVVTHERQVVGIISSFDLLKLVDGKRFVMKNLPATKAKKRR